MIARLHSDGTLTDIANRSPLTYTDGSTDVPVATMPSGFGPFGYDAATQTAIPWFPAYQAAKCSAIDSRTQQLLAAGFAYNGNQFGLDPTSSTNWMGMTMAAAGLTYPFSIATVGGQIVTLSSASDVQAFFAAGVARSAAVQQGGIALKAAVMAATTQAGVDAVEDNRT